MRAAPRFVHALLALGVAFAPPASCYRAVVWTQRGISTLVFDESDAETAPEPQAAATFCDIRGFAADECHAVWVCTTGTATSALYHVKNDDPSATPQPLSVVDTEESPDSLKYDVAMDVMKNAVFYSEYVPGVPAGAFKVKVDMLVPCLQLDENACASAMTCEWEVGTAACKRVALPPSVVVPAESDESGGFVRVGNTLYVTAMAEGAAQLYRVDVQRMGASATTASDGVEAYWKSDVLPGMVLGKPRFSTGSVYIPVIDPVGARTAIHRVETGNLDTILPNVYDFPFLIRPYVQPLAQEAGMVPQPNFAVLPSGAIVYTDGTRIYFNSLTSFPTELYEETDASLLPIGPLAVEHIPCRPPPTPLPPTPVPSPPTPLPPTPAPAADPTPVPAGTAAPGIDGNETSGATDAPSPAPDPRTTPPSSGTLQPLDDGSSDDDDGAVWIFVVLGACVAVGAVCCFAIYRATRPAIVPAGGGGAGARGPPPPGDGPRGVGGPIGIGDDEEFELQPRPKPRPARIKKLPLEAMPTDHINYADRPGELQAAERALDAYRRTGAPSGMTNAAKVAKEKDRLRGMVADNFAHDAVDGWREEQEAIHVQEVEDAMYHASIQPTSAQSPVRMSQPYVSLVPVPQAPTPPQPAIPVSAARRRSERLSVTSKPE